MNAPTRHSGARRHSMSRPHFCLLVLLGCFLSSAQAADLEWAGSPDVSFSGLSSATFSPGSLVNNTGSDKDVTIQIWASSSPWNGGDLNGYLMAETGPLRVDANGSSPVSFSQRPLPVPAGIWYLTALAVTGNGIEASVNYPDPVARLADRWDRVGIEQGTIGRSTSSGGFGVSIYSFPAPVLLPGETEAYLTFRYSMASIPDRADVSYGGRVVFSTLDYVSGTYTVTLPPWTPADGTITVRMDGSSPRTAWSFTLSQVSAPPESITSARAVVHPVNTPFSYQITATSPATSYSSSSLPFWASLNTTTGLITGTPTSLSRDEFTVRANLASGITVSTLVSYEIVATGVATPVLQNPQTVDLYQGQAAGFTIIAQNNPDAFNVGVAASGSANAGSLPAGLSINRSTGEISGTPTQTGSFRIATAAGNQAGIGVGSLLLNVYPAPRLPALADVTIRIGQPYSLDIDTLDAPATAANISGNLPTGLNFDANTLIFSGTPTQLGSFPITLSVSNPVGNDSASFTVTVVPPPPPVVTGVQAIGAGQDAWATRDLTLPFSGTNPNEAGYVLCIVNGTEIERTPASGTDWNLILPQFGEGAYVIEVIFEDAFGQQSVADAFNLTIDRTFAPVLTPIGYQNSSGCVEFRLTAPESFTGFDPSLLSITGGTLQEWSQLQDGTIVIQVLPSQEGTIGVAIAAGGLNDWVGNASALLSESVQIDLPPVVRAGPDLVTNTAVALQGSVTPFPGDTIGAILWEQISATPNGGTVTFTDDSSATSTVAADQDGTYTLRLTGTDAGGTSASEEMTFVWDTTAPPVPLGLVIAGGAAATNNSQPPVTGAPNEPGATIIVFNSIGNELGRGTVQGDGSWSVIPVSPLADGVVEVHAVAEDAAGNRSAVSGATSTIIDTVAPVLSLSLPQGPLIGVTDTEATVVVSEAITGFASADLQIAAHGTVGTMTDEFSTDSRFRFAISITGSGLLEIVIPAGSVVDQAQNPNAEVRASVAVLPNRDGLDLTSLTVTGTWSDDQGLTNATLEADNQANLIQNGADWSVTVDLPGISPEQAETTITATDVGGRVTSRTFTVDTMPGSNL